MLAVLGVLTCFDPSPHVGLSENRIYPPGYGIFIGKMDEHGDNPLDLEIPYLETDMSH